MEQTTALPALRERADGSCNPLFQSPWWLAQAGQGRCETVEVHWDGQRVGALSFLRSHRFGMTVLRMPPYTRTLDPLITPPRSKPYQELANTRRILQALLMKLPRHDQFLIALSPDVDTTIPLAFDVSGLRIGAAFTFIAPREASPDAIWAGMDHKTRNLVRSAGRVCRVIQGDDFDRFERLLRHEYDAPSRTGGTTHDYAILRALHTAASSRGQAAILFAAHDDGDAAAIILVWDAATIYYWTSARDRTRVSGASALLVWHAVRLAHGRGLALDLDSYSSPATARFLTTFGLPPAIRPVVEKSSLRYRAARLVQDGLRHVRQ